MSGIVKLGPTAVQKVIAPSYDPSNTTGDSSAVGYYVEGDFCVYHGKFYKCNDTTYGAFNPLKWDETTVSENFGTGDDFTGATSSAAGAHGMVPAPSAGDQNKVLTGAGTWEVSQGVKLYTRTFTITNTSGSYTHVFEDENLAQDMEAVRVEVNRDYVFGATIFFTCGTGQVTIECADVSGTDTITVAFMKVVADPSSMTSVEFTILNNRIVALTDRLKSGAEADAELHLGFYLDENGDLCQVETDEEEEEGE